MIVPEQIKTERLVLRRHQMKDLDAFAAFLTHPTAASYMAFTADQRNRDGAKQMLDYVIDSYAGENPILSLTIADPVTDEYLGSCGASPDGEDIEIYYTLLPEHQGNGYATEAAAALVEHLKATTPATLVAYVIPKNAPSVRVAEQLGFKDAGPVKRQATTGQYEHETLEGRKYILPELRS